MVKNRLSRAVQMRNPFMMLAQCCSNALTLLDQVRMQSEYRVNFTREILGELKNLYDVQRLNIALWEL